MARIIKVDVEAVPVELRNADMHWLVPDLWEEGFLHP